MRVRRAVHFAVSLPGDRGRIVSGFRAGSGINIFFNLKWWLREGRPAYRSANNVICIYESVPMPFLLYVVDKRLGRELRSDSPNVNLMTDVQSDCLGVTTDGSWAETPAHSRITLTPA